MSHNTYRYAGRPGKVGIRPAIDGRLGGVRESLESQTMGMARAVEKLIGGNLRHINGDPVECVIPDHCIGGVAEAAACAELFKREGVTVSLTVTPCWCYGSETMDMDPLTPKAIWGFNGTERPGAVYLAATLAAHNQKGLPAFGIYGREVQDSGDKSIPADVQEKILRFVRAAVAATEMRGKSYLAMGGVSMGIGGSIVDHDFFESYLGMRVETIDMSEFSRRIEKGIYNHEELSIALDWVKKNCREGKDYNAKDKQRSRAQKDSDWEISVKMALIARDLMVGNRRLAEMGHGEEALGRNALAGGFQGQRQWTDFMPNGDFMEAILNSSFDWNGIRQPYIVATENDALNGASMLLGHMLTGTAQIFADVRTYWSPEAVKRVTGHKLTGNAAGGIIHMINSGPAALDGTGEQQRNRKPAIKPFWDVTEKEAHACLKATTWHASDLGYFRGGGWSTRFTTRGGMPMTMCRINMVRGLGPALQIAEGYSIELPEKVHATLDERTNPTWPTTWFAPITTGHGVFRDVYSVMNAWGANHCSISYGHIGDDLISLASILRIPVYMHNVGEDRIFRPSAWTAFGTADMEAADFRACSTYGPLYKS
jgi:L-fucose isomerase